MYHHQYTKIGIEESILESKMKAKEMFEALGWEQIKNDNFCIVYTRGFRMITFFKNDKAIASSCHITVEWFKAIHLQMKELGWL